MLRSLMWVAVFVGMCFSAFASDGSMEKVNVFTAGQGGYAHYRIPGIAVTRKGTILAWCEARKTTKSDWTSIDILLRRSLDGGKTWGRRQNLTADAPKVPKNEVALKQKLADPNERTYNNPVMIVDHVSSDIHFLFCAEYGRCYYCSSSDDGVIFSKPADITNTFLAYRAQYDWRVIATGPNHSIQLKNGRLVVPIWMSTGTGGHAHRPSCVSVIYSNDHGRTWQAGDIVCCDDNPLKNPSETVAVQLHNGLVMLNTRSESPRYRRAVSYSADGATQWTRPVFDEALFEPVCMGAIIRLTEQPRYKRNRILFSNPDSRDDLRSKQRMQAGRGSCPRENVSVKLSYDEGQTWPVNKLIEDGISGYSDLAVGRDGTIYCFYERGTASKSHYNPKHLCVARFDLEWLTDGKDTLDPAK